MNSSSSTTYHSLCVENELPIWTEPLSLQVYHQTTYLYEGSVFESYNEARLHPLEDSSQTCTQFALEVIPQANVREFPDAYFNEVQYIDIPQFHDRFVVTARSLVKTRADDRGPLMGDYPQSALQAAALQIECFEFLQVSPHISITPKILEVSQSICKNLADDVWLKSAAILRFVHTHVIYQSESTHVDTRPEEVLELGYGVCQDFTHLMIALCRAQGIPARYVSGYFYHPERASDESEASHAWVEIYLPNYGWKGLDPTHRRLIDTRYVKLATGRDYADVRPLAGTFRGKGTASMSVDVRISKVEGSP